MSAALSPEKVQAAIEKLDGWSYQDNAIHKQYTFENFREAISFIVRLSFHAEAMNHHPELSNVYNKVTIKLTTHDADDKVTDKDIKLAQEIESFNWAKA